MEDGQDYFQMVLSSLGFQIQQSSESDATIRTYSDVQQQVFMNEKFLVEQYTCDTLDIDTGCLLHVLAKLQTKGNTNENFGRLLIQYSNAYQLDGEKKEQQTVKDFLKKDDSWQSGLSRYRIDYNNRRTPYKHRMHWWMFLREVQFLFRIVEHKRGSVRAWR